MLSLSHSTLSLTPYYTVSLLATNRASVFLFTVCMVPPNIH